MNRSKVNTNASMAFIGTDIYLNAHILELFRGAKKFSLNNACKNLRNSSKSVASFSNHSLCNDLIFKIRTLNVSVHQSSIGTSERSKKSLIFQKLQIG